MHGGGCGLCCVGLSLFTQYGTCDRTNESVSLTYWVGRAVSCGIHQLYPVGYNRFGSVTIPVVLLCGTAGTHCPPRLRPASARDAIGPDRSRQGPRRFPPGIASRCQHVTGLLVLCNSLRCSDFLKVRGRVRVNPTGNGSLFGPTIPEKTCQTHFQKD